MCIYHSKQLLTFCLGLLLVLLCIFAFSEQQTREMLKRSREESSNTTRVLYSYWRSSCSWRVRVALEYKQLEYEYRAINLLKGEDSAPAYLALNPAGLVPTLVDDGNVIGQSMAILEFLEERYPERPILPRGFAQRAKCRAIAMVIVSGIQPLQNLGVLEKVAKFGDDKKQPWGREVIAEGLEVVETMLKESAGRFCVGDEISIADFCLIPQLYNAGRFNVDLSKYPTLLRVQQNLEPLDCFKAAHPDRMPDATK